MTSQQKDFPIRKETLEQLAQKQIEEINEQLSSDQLDHSTGQSSPKDDPGLPLNRTTSADLFSGMPSEIPPDES